MRVCVLEIVCVRECVRGCVLESEYVRECKRVCEDSQSSQSCSKQSCSKQSCSPRMRPAPGAVVGGGGEPGVQEGIIHARPLASPLQISRAWMQPNTSVYQSSDMCNAPRKTDKPFHYVA